MKLINSRGRLVARRGRSCDIRQVGVHAFNPFEPSEDRGSWKKTKKQGGRGKKGKVAEE